MSRLDKEPTLTSFGELFLPAEANEPILARAVRGALTEWLTEIWAEDELRAVGIGPRKRAIFDGPPGVGKTTLAHHLSARLGLPMLAVRPDLLMSKWVHQTAEQIGQLFELAKLGLGEDHTPVVLFFDEFDALARQRRSAQQSADDGRNEDVDTLLQRIEQHAGFLIAATNYAGEIDQALWRRFDMHITLELPGLPERVRILARYLAPYGLPKRELAELAAAFETASPALMRSFCEDLKRQIVIGPMLKSDMRREAVIERVLASRKPHPDLGLPRLWSLGAADRAVAMIPWPLPLAAALPASAEIVSADAPATENVVQFGRSPDRKSVV